jgi:hypothetical protein
MSTLETGKKEFCMIEAYMDESGIHEGAHVCVIGGYWGSIKKWKRFERRWKQIIEDAGEPTLKEFHSTDFWYADGRRKGIFARWSNDKADKFIADLATCIVDSGIYPTAAVLVVADWKKLNKDERMFLTGGRYNKSTLKWVTRGAPNRLYFLPFQFAIEYPALSCQAGLHVHYVFDLNKQFKKHALDLFGLMKIDPKINARHRMGALDFETGEAAPGLQAADMLAYQIYKFSKVRIEFGKLAKRSQMSPLLQKIIKNVREHHDFPFLDKEGLNVVLHNMPTHLRSPGWTPVTLKLSTGDLRKH